MSNDTLLAVSTSPAQTLAESTPRLHLEPLGPDSAFYAPLEAGRATKELHKLDLFLRGAARTPSAWAKCAFVGSRGSGKSTFLLHIERQLEDAGLFTPVHIELDPSLESDCDYSDLFLWMVDEIAREFDRRGHPVDPRKLSDVVVWFADTALTKTTEWKKEIGLEAGVEAKGGGGLPAIFSFKLLARLKSMISGSEQSRREMRQKLQNYATDLRERMNAFLHHARETLRTAGKPDRLLIVQDNLDRVRPREQAQRLFDAGGDMLMELRADIIYTAPLALHLAPLDISRTFGHVFTMPNVKVRLRNGKPHKPGIDSLVVLIGKRMALDLVFESDRVVRYLADKSGGSVRDLIRLLDEAQLEAQVAGVQRVDMAAAKAAVHKTALNYTRLLQPASVYFPILADIHRRKGEYQPGEGAATVASVADARAFFAELLGNGSVFEYNGEDSWYDVHPAVCETEQFQNAFKETGTTPAS